MNRIIELDFIRAIVILFVIGIHVSADYVLLNSNALLWNKTMVSAVPIFIMLSGFGLMYSELSKKTNFLTFSRKRMKKICIPYIFWSTFYFFIYKLAFSPIETNIQAFKRMIKGLILGNTLYHLYFLVILIFLYLLFPFLKRTMISFPKVVLSISILSFILSTHFLDNLTNVFNVFGYYQPLNWLIYFVTGMFTAYKLNIVRNRIFRKEVFWMLLYFFSFFLFFKQNSISYLKHINPEYFRAIYSIVSFYTFFGIAIQYFALNLPFNRVINWISKHSFLMYLTHPIMLLGLYLLSIRLPIINSLFEGTIGMGLKYIFVILSTMIFTFIISVIPYSPLIGGIKININFPNSYKNSRHS